MIRLLARFSVVLVLPLLVSCGYHMGSMMHPQIKTVAIAPVVNESKLPMAATQLRKLLSERFQFDNSLKVVSLEKADCIVYARVMQVNTSTVVQASSDNDQTYRPYESKLTMNVEFSVLIPGNKVPLVKKRNVTGETLYTYANDPNVAMEFALQQASRVAADYIVQYTTEAW